MLRRLLSQLENMNLYKMNDNIIIPLEPCHEGITTGKGIIASVELPEHLREFASVKTGFYEATTDLAVDGAIITSKIHDVSTKPSFDQVKILTSTVKISDTAMALAFNKDVNYDNKIKRQAAIKLLEQLLDEGFITFQKIATVEPATILQAKIIAIQQEDI